MDPFNGGFCILASSGPVLSPRLQFDISRVPRPAPTAYLWTARIRISSFVVINSRGAPPWSPHFQYQTVAPCRFQRHAWKAAHYALHKPKPLISATKWDSVNTAGGNF